MRYLLSCFSLMLSLAGMVSGANWYVRPTATGSGSGADWSNAWSLNSIQWSSVHGGDTVWLAGGSYNGDLVTGASGGNGNSILIQRAQSTDNAATQAAGWQSGFDSQAKISSINVPGQSWVTINGRVPSGILVTVGSGGGNGMSGASQGSISNIWVSYVEFAGPPNLSGLNSGRYGINIAPSNNSVTNLTIDHCYVHQWCEALRASNWNNVTIQYSTIGDTQTDNIDHADLIYSYPSTNVTFRYNSIFKSPVDGIFFEYGGATNFRFYGNYYWNSTNHFIFFKGSGSTTNYGPVLIYNNVFACPSTNPDGYLSDEAGSTYAAGSVIENNIFFNVLNSFNGAGFQSDYNAYNYTNLGGFGWPNNEAHSFTFSGNPFVNSGSGDFHLTSGASAQFQNGTPLASDGFLNKDADGNTRGNTSWTIGAYQVASGPLTPTPAGLFSIGSTVTAALDVNVRQTPAGPLVTPVGFQVAGTSAKVVSGPIAARFNNAQVIWWQLSFTNSPSGWVGQDNLVQALPTPSPTPTASPTPSPTPNQVFTTWIAKMNAYIKANKPTADQLNAWIKANQATAN